MAADQSPKDAAFDEKRRGTDEGHGTSRMNVEIGIVYLALVRVFGGPSQLAQYLRSNEVWRARTARTCLRVSIGLNDRAA